MELERRLRLLSQIAALAVVLSASAVPASGGAGALDIGSRLQLFTDDYLIDAMRGVELRLNHPVPRETAIAFDAPWEGDTCAYVTVFKDGERYRMYYRGSSESPSHTMTACMAESADGIVWTRPKLGLFEFAGSKDNNIVWMGAGADCFTPFRDANPRAADSERYKALVVLRPGGDKTKKAVLYALISQDGIRWKQMREEPIITDGAFDSQNLAFWDTVRGEYVCYFRDFKDGVRMIKRATSKDFRTWSPAEDLTYTGAPPENLYTNAITPYPREPHIYVGFPKRFMPERKAVPEHKNPGVSDGVFMSSRDGLSFHLWNEAFIRPGLDRENWTDRNIMASWGLLQLKPGELSLYYSEHYRHPTNRLTRATIRTDGFCSLHAGTETRPYVAGTETRPYVAGTETRPYVAVGLRADRGEVVTKPFVFSGKELVINYATSAIGGIRIQIEDAGGVPTKGFGLEDCPVIYGDEIERVVRWNSGSDVSALAGKPVRLRFEMLDADLYSIRFTKG